MHKGDSRFKFRAYGHLSDGAYKMHYKINAFDNYMIPYIDDEPICDHDLMQYSGLKDSKGVEIYEGDVVRLSGYGDYVVEFPFQQLYDSLGENDIGEIKGNIYQNPALLLDVKYD